jgi:glycosyltransferase involved in cell wall biosynthesis
MNKKIDIIIPAYKAQNTITRTLGSIMIQSIVDQVKVTIVNDCDEIGYKNIVNTFKQFVEIEELTLKENGGPGVARQHGIDNTKLPFLTFIDADDTFANSFALELLLSKIENEKEYHTAVGVFSEEQGKLQFYKHENDLVWMFGKLYKRSFINQYKIAFNKTRANEDTGFNTIVRLCSSETEKIMFLPDIVYYWHYKEDSITRINNAEYSYNQSFPGYTENMIYAIKHAKQLKPFNSYVDMWAIQSMVQLYTYYLETVKRDPRFSEQNFKWCSIYYHEIYKQYDETFPKDAIDQIFGETLMEKAPGMRDIVPHMTIYQFLEELKKEVHEL